MALTAELPETETDIQVVEVECSAVLQRTGLTDYTVDGYQGCEHSCVYCSHQPLFRGERQNGIWGKRVEVRVNAPEVLAREVTRFRKGRVLLSHGCDGWQPVEEHYGISRRLLEVLRHHHIPITILSKGHGVVRDFDLLSKRGRVEFGVSLCTMDRSLWLELEPRAASVDERLALLERAKSKGLDCFVFLGPLIPDLTDTPEDLRNAFQCLAELRVDFFYVDTLIPSPKVWFGVKAYLERAHPEMVEQVRQVLYDRQARDAYKERLRRRVTSMAKRHGLVERLIFCF